MNTEELKCPCEVCITFCICRVKMHAPKALLYHIMERCQILQEYLLEKNENTDIVYYKIQTTLETFGLDPNRTPGINTIKTISKQQLFEPDESKELKIDNTNMISKGLTWIKKNVLAKIV